jgi:hypothetical protein
MRIAFNAQPVQGICSGLCQSCCGVSAAPIPIILSSVDIGYAILVSYILRESNDDDLLNTTALVIAVFAESQATNISVHDKVTLCCIIRRARYELGRFGGLFGGSLLAGFPWCFTRGARVASELKALEDRVLRVAVAACTTSSQKSFLSSSLAATWARPQLADLLLIKRVDAITPANDERKMGDDMDTVTTQEVQELLHSRALERSQPQSANTMYAAPPQSAWHFSPQERWHAPVPAPVQAAPVASHDMPVVGAGAVATEPAAAARLKDGEAGEDRDDGEDGDDGEEGDVQVVEADGEEEACVEAEVRDDGDQNEAGDDEGNIVEDVDEGQFDHED